MILCAETSIEDVEDRGVFKVMQVHYAPCGCTAMPQISFVSHQKDRVWWILRGLDVDVSMLAVPCTGVRTHLVQDGDEEHLSTNEVRNFLVWVPQSMEYIELWVAGKRIAPLNIQRLFAEAVRL